MSGIPSVSWSPAVTSTNIVSALAELNSTARELRTLASILAMPHPPPSSRKKVMNGNGVSNGHLTHSVSTANTADAMLPHVTSNLNGGFGKRSDQLDGVVQQLETWTEKIKRGDQVQWIEREESHQRQTKIVHQTNGNGYSSAALNNHSNSNFSSTNGRNGHSQSNGNKSTNDHEYQSNGHHNSNGTHATYPARLERVPPTTSESSNFSNFSPTYSSSDQFSQQPPPQQRRSYQPSPKSSPKPTSSTIPPSSPAAIVFNTPAPQAPSSVTSNNMATSSPAWTTSPIVHEQPTPTQPTASMPYYYLPIDRSTKTNSRTKEYFTNSSLHTPQPQSRQANSTQPPSSQSQQFNSPREAQYQYQTQPEFEKTIPAATIRLQDRLEQRDLNLSSATVPIISDYEFTSPTPRLSTTQEPLPNTYVAATPAFAPVDLKNVGPIDETGVNSILSLNSDVPVEISSRLVARAGPRFTVEVLLGLDGVSMGTARASALSYEDAESLALLHVMDRCSVPLRTFESTRHSGAYFSSNYYDDQDFPLSPTRPPPIADPAKMKESFAPDTVSSPSHPYFGLIPPPVNEAQAVKCDAAALTTNALFAQQHRVTTVPDLQFYHSRSLHGHHLRNNQHSVISQSSDPRVRLQEYLFRKTQGEFQPDETVDARAEEHSQGHTVAIEQDIAQPSPLPRPPIAERKYYDPTSAVSPKRQLLHHFLQLRTRAYADINQEVSLLRAFSRATRITSEDGAVYPDQLSAEERDHATLHATAQQPFTSPDDARAWRARLEQFEFVEEAPTMAQAERIVQAALTTPVQSTRKKLDHALRSPHAFPTTTMTTSPPANAIYTPSSQMQREKDVTGWRKYAFHWSFMKSPSEPSPSAHFATTTSNTVPIEQRPRWNPTQLVTPPSKVAAGANATTKSPSPNSDVDLLPSPISLHSRLAARATSAGLPSTSLPAAYDPLPPRELPFDQWCHNHTFHEDPLGLEAANQHRTKLRTEAEADRRKEREQDWQFSRQQLAHLRATQGF